MPGVTTKAGGLIAKKLGNRAAKAAATKPQELDYGFQRLPPGITNGVLRLTACEVKQYPTDHKSLPGEVYFRAAGVVVSPEFIELDGQKIKVAGMQSSIIENIMDTKLGTEKAMTAEQHLHEVWNRMAIMSSPNRNEARAFLAQLNQDNTEEFCRILSEAGTEKSALPPIYVRFSTNETPEVKNPDGTVQFEKRTWERWYGATEFHEEGAAGTAVEDSSPPATKPGANGAAARPPANRIAPTGGRAVTAPPPPARKPAPAPRGPNAPRPEEVPDNSNDNADGAQDDEPAVAADAGAGEDLDALIARAVNDEQEAMDAVVEIVNGLDITAAEKSRILSLKTWPEVQTEIEAVQAGGGGVEAAMDEEPAEFVPEKGGIYFFSAKDSKGAMRKHEVEVVTLDKAKKTATLKYNETKKPVANKEGKPVAISWDKLSET